MEFRILYAPSFLVTVVIQQLEDVFAEEDQSDKVTQREQGHEQVTQVPNKLKTGYSTKENESTSREEAENREHPLLAG